MHSQVVKNEVEMQRQHSDKRALVCCAVAWRGAAQLRVGRIGAGHGAPDSIANTLLHPSTTASLPEQPQLLQVDFHLLLVVPCSIDALLLLPHQAIQVELTINVNQAQPVGAKAGGGSSRQH